MKNTNRTVSALIISATLIGLPHLASGMERLTEGRMTQVERLEQKEASQPKIVRWIGTVEDDPSSRSAQHELRFERKDTGDVYRIKKHLELAKLHRETGQSDLLAIEAEKTPRFLFWGGELIIRKFTVIGDQESPSHCSPAC